MMTERFMNGTGKAGRMADRTKLGGSARTVLRITGAAMLGLLVLSVLPTAMAFQQADEAAGQITAVRPLSFVHRGDDALQSRKGTPIYWQDTVETRRGGRVRIGMSDGSVLNVGSETKLRIVRHDVAAEQTEIELVAGKLRASVVKRSRANGSFEIRTSAAVAGVIGTDEFIDGSNPARTCAVALQGVVSMTSADPTIPGSQSLFPGETTCVQAGQPPEPKRQATPEEMQQALDSTTQNTEFSLSPASGQQGTVVDAAILGRNLLAVESLTIAGEGVSIAPADGATDTNMPVQIAVTEDAPLGPRTVTFTLAGSQFELEFTVLPKPSYQILLSPRNTTASPLWVQLGTSSSPLTVAVHPLADFEGTVDMTLSGLPAGVTADWMTAAIATGQSTALSFTASASAEPGDYIALLQAVSGDMLAELPIYLHLDTEEDPNAGMSFSLVLLPATAQDSPLAVFPGTTTQPFAVSLAVEEGFSGQANLAVTALPEGVELAGDLGTVSGTQAAELAFVIAENAAPGLYAIPIVATAGALTTNAAIYLSVEPPLPVLSVSVENYHTASEPPMPVSGTTLQVEQGSVIRFDASETHVPGGGRIAGFDWNVGGGGDASTAATFEVDTWQLPPGTFTVQLAATSDLGAVATWDFSLTVDGIDYSAADAVIETCIRQGYESLQVSQFMGCFDPTLFPDYSQLEETMRTLFQQIAEARVFYRIDNRQTNRDTVDYQIRFELTYSTKDKPSEELTAVDRLTIRIQRFFDPVGEPTWAVTNFASQTQIDVSGAFGGNSAPVAADIPLVLDEDGVGTLRLTATDGENDALTFTLSADPINGTASLEGDTLSYTPAENFFGTDTVEYFANDGTNDSGIGTVSITVNPVNDAPVVGDFVLELDEDNTGTVTLSATDIEGDPVTFVAVGEPQNGDQVIEGDTLTYTPRGNYFGPDAVTFVANDGQDNGNVGTISVSVNPVNDRPIADNLPGETVDEDGSVTITLTGSDIDGDPLTFRVVTESTPDTLSGISGDQITYSPTGDFNGSDSFTYVANDGTVDSAPATVSITINPVNDAPVANDGSFSTSEDLAVAITLTGSDIDGDPLTFSVAGQPLHGSLSPGEIGPVYSPAADFNGSDSFTYVANDGTVDSAPATVSITINPVNDAPVANDGSFSTSEDLAVAITLTGSDIDNSPAELIYSIVGNPLNGTLSGAGTDLAYAPHDNFNGGDSFTFTISDGSLTSNTATVTISVGKVNDAPIADDLPGETVDEDGSVTITLTGSDIDGDPLTFRVVTQSTPDTLSGIAGDQITYTPTGDFNGSDSFTYVANDGTVDSAPATVSITINPVNDAPVANDGSFSTSEDLAVAITLTGSDIDNSPAELIYSIVGNPLNGTLSGAGTDLAYAPHDNFNGGDSFTFTISDGSLTSNTATVTISVGKVNDIPAVEGQLISVDEDGAVSITLTGSDIDGDALTYSVVTASTNGTLSPIAGDTLTYSPYADSFESDGFTFVANDGLADSALGTISITVNPVNDAPVLDPVADQTVKIESSLTLTLTASDVDDSALTFSISPPLAFAALDGATLVFSPLIGDDGIHEVTVTVTDPSSASASHVFSLNVTGDTGVTLTPSPASFGQVLLGTTDTVPVTIENTGTLDISIDSITVTGGAGTFSADGATILGVLPARQSATFNATFSPSLACTAVAGEITVATTASGSPHILALAGTGVQSAVALSVDTLDFGSILVGTEATATVGVMNSGCATLTISAVALETAGTDFGLTPPAVPLAVAPGGVATLSVTYAPALEGAATNSVVIISDAPGTPHAIPLTGNGVAPRLLIEPTTVNFGALTAGTTGAAQTVTITNSGSADLTVNGIALTGAAGFSLALPPMPATVAPSGTLTFDVDFTPVAAGDFTDTVAITTDAGDAIVTLNGSGIEPIGDLFEIVTDNSDASLNDSSNPESVTPGGSGQVTIRAAELDPSVPKGQILITVLDPGLNWLTITCVSSNCENSLEAKVFLNTPQPEWGVFQLTAAANTPVGQVASVSVTTSGSAGTVSSEFYVQVISATAIAATAGLQTDSTSSGSGKPLGTGSTGIAGRPCVLGARTTQTAESPRRTGRLATTVGTETRSLSMPSGECASPTTDLSVRAGEVTMVPREIRPGEPVEFRIPIHNGGSAEVRDVTVEFALSTLNIKHRETVNLGPNETVSLAVAMEFTLQDFRRALRPQVTIDPDQALTESSRTNNVATLEPLALAPEYAVLAAPFRQLRNRARLVLEPGGCAGLDLSGRRVDCDMNPDLVISSTPDGFVILLSADELGTVAGTNFDQVRQIPDTLSSRQLPLQPGTVVAVRTLRNQTALVRIVRVRRTAALRTRSRLPSEVDAPAKSGHHGLRGGVSYVDSTGDMQQLIQVEIEWIGGM